MCAVGMQTGIHISFSYAWENGSVLAGLSLSSGSHFLSCSPAPPHISPTQNSFHSLIPRRSYQVRRAYQVKKSIWMWLAYGSYLSQRPTTALLCPFPSLPDTSSGMRVHLLVLLESQATRLCRTIQSSPVMSLYSVLITWQFQMTGALHIFV